MTEHLQTINLFRIFKSIKNPWAHLLWPIAAKKNTTVKHLPHFKSIILLHDVLIYHIDL